MNEYEIKLANIMSAIEYDFPDFKIVEKQNSKLMRILSKVLFFNKKFMTNYVTVIGNTVYVPSKQWVKDNPYAALEVFCHEWVHMKDNRELGPLFKFLYLTPQIFSLMSLFSLWSGNLWWLLCLIYLLPMPSLARSELEMRGYAVSMAVRWWVLEQEPDYERISKYFTSSAYYWMYPVKSGVIQDLEENFERIKKMDLRPHEQQILEILIDRP
tara:strand:- start:180 stop:818 length:639 start_codon:yes stop_codon:yes gene_type:complete